MGTGLSCAPVAEQNALGDEIYAFTLARNRKRARIGIQHPKRGAGAIGDIQRPKPRDQIKPRRHVTRQGGIGAGQFGSAKNLPARCRVFIHAPGQKARIPAR
jgi:hypothetical protein